MDDLDRAILDIIQSNFPLTPRPYKAIGDEVGLTEAEALARVRALKNSGVIRRMGANFNSRGLGWHSTLCAAEVPGDKLEEFTAEVNRHLGVTHNYLRRHRLNVWFTYIGPSPEFVADKLAAITESTGIPIRNLPATDMYKIKVDFKMQQGETA
ncbi:AsnC family transcriptional regulator [Desulfohalovibrio reitneri]|uniref:siroheme decarboxylase subunit alpha n=1 Tax=Desulfohalovibrio reitneri TaxID=1307759 RepID=UPI0004A7787A|nr:AsnC family transcriptional regulator [Desulfohalovibrio reitneri]